MDIKEQVATILEVKRSISSALSADAWEYVGDDTYGKMGWAAKFVRGDEKLDVVLFVTDLAAPDLSGVLAVLKPNLPLDVAS